MKNAIILFWLCCITNFLSFSQQWQKFYSTNPCNSLAFTKNQIWVGESGYIKVFGLKGEVLNSYFIQNTFTSDQTIYSIAIDKNAQKWIGTDYGVKMFDGNSWNSYNTYNGLIANQVNAITIDQYNKVWIGTSSGISMFDSGKWTNYPNNYIVSIATDKKGNLWCGTYSGVLKFDGLNWTTFLSGRQVNSIACDSLGKVWFGTDYGVSMLKDSVWTQYLEQDSLINNSVTCICIDKNNNKWFGTSNGISKFTDSTWVSYTTKDGLLNNGIKNISIDSSGNIWAGVYISGLMKFNGKSWESISISDNNVYNISIDKAGNKWYSTQSGLSKFDGKNWINFNASNGLPTDQVATITADSFNNIWVGTYYGLSKFDGISWINYRTKDGLVNDVVNSIAVDKNGIIWIGTQGGLSRFDGINWQTLGSNAVYTVKIDKSGNVWVGENGAAYKYDGLNWTKFSFTSDYIGAIEFDNQDNIWFGTWLNGVSKYDGKRMTKYDNSKGFPGNKANSIFQDRNGNLWFGSDWGLSRYDGYTWISYSQMGSTSIPQVSSINSDSIGSIWISSSNGVYKHILSSENKILSFSFLNVNVVKNTMDSISKTIHITVDSTTNVTNLIADFAISPYATLRLDSINQYSGIDSNNYCLPLTFTVISEVGTKSNYTVIVDGSKINSIAFALKNNINIYPNPTNGYFKVEKNCDINSIKISNQQGQILKTFYKDDYDNINISDLPSGIYFVIFYDKINFSVTKKIIKN